MAPPPTTPIAAPADSEGSGQQESELPEASSSVLAPNVDNLPTPAAGPAGEATQVTKKKVPAAAPPRIENSQSPLPQQYPGNYGANPGMQYGFRPPGGPELFRNMSTSKNSYSSNSYSTRENTASIGEYDQNGKLVGEKTSESKSSADESVSSQQEKSEGLKLRRVYNGTDLVSEDKVGTKEDTVSKVESKSESNDEVETSRNVDEGREINP
jgi:hypothetical protein